MSVLPACMSMHILVCHRGLRKVLDPLELQFQVVVVNGHEGARDSSYLGPLEEQPRL